MEYSDLPVKAEHAAVDQRPAAQDAGIVEEIFRGEVVASVDDNVVVGDHIEHIVRGEPNRVAVDGDLRVQIAKALRGRIGLLAPDIVRVKRNLALKIAHIDRVEIEDAEGTDTGGGQIEAGRRPEPDFTWDRLRGRTVLVDHFFQPLAMFRYALHRRGVDVAALEVIDTGGVEAIERAFRDGIGDYVHLQGPAPQQLEHEGIAHVVAAVGDAVGPVAFSSLCANRAWLATDMAHAFMRAYRHAREHAIVAPADGIAALLREAGFFPAIDPVVLAGTVGAYQRLGCWTPDPAISPESYERLLDVFLFSGLITRRHPYAAAVVPPP